jgi:hypothetical protein
MVEKLHGGLASGRRKRNIVERLTGFILFEELDLDRSEAQLI